MKITPKTRDIRLRYYGPGKPRIIQPGEQTINPQDAEIQAMVLNAISTGSFLRTTGGTMTGQLSLSNVDIVLSTGTGTKIGTTASQKLGFFGLTPVVQPSSVGTVSGFTAGSGTAVKDDSTFTGGVGSKAYTIGDIIKHLKNIGIIASS